MHTHVTLRCFMGRETAVFVGGEQLLNSPFPVGLLSTVAYTSNMRAVSTEGKLCSVTLTLKSSRLLAFEQLMTVTDCNTLDKGFALMMHLL